MQKILKNLEITDNSQNDKYIFSDVSNLMNSVLNKTFEQLEKEGIFVFPQNIQNSHDINNDQMIFKLINNKIQTSNIMGFFGSEQEKITIRSRFSRNNDDFFFQYLLERVMDIPNIVSLNTEMNQTDKFINLLVFIFPYYVKKALKKGVYKEYITRNYNDNQIKGKLDIQRFVRTNIPFMGRISYETREFSYDNKVMELIRHTIEFIKNSSFGSFLLKDIINEVEKVVEVTPKYERIRRMKIVEENDNNLVHHGYYSEYRALQSLCIMILKKEKHQIGVGNNRISGILFDGAWLWEEYVNKLIQDKFYHPMNKERKNGQRLFFSNDKNVGLVYPDFISKNINERIIADAKYKPINSIGNRDYLQVLAYMLRFESKKGYYIYPETTDEIQRVFYLNSGTTYEEVTVSNDFYVKKIGIKIPKANDYKEFKKLMYENEKEFLMNL